MGYDQSLGSIVIISGLSGSGKSTALNALEDNGYFCIDNLPVLLLPKFLALQKEANLEIVKLGLVMDMREKEFVKSFKEVFHHLKSQDINVLVLFMEASDQVLVKRFSETRRRHPLAESGNLLEGIRRERELMNPVRMEADEILDTTTYNARDLRKRLTNRFGKADLERSLSVEIMSFGFKFGLPPEADIVMDVRFLPNPFYLDELRELDGTDHRVVEYVLASEDSGNFLNKFSELLNFVLPMYQREGKSYLVIAIGCTGGQHRSVTIVNELAGRLREKNGAVTVRHRDIVRRRENI